MRTPSVLSRVAVVVGAGLCVLAPASAESVSGAERMLCTVQEVAVCPPQAECAAGSPLDWNVPDFIVVDVAAKRLSTTASNERPRATTASHLERDQGVLFLQGVENSRAYSIVIDEATGELSAAVSAPAANISVYGVCTSLPITPPASGS